MNEFTTYYTDPQYRKFFKSMRKYKYIEVREKENENLVYAHDIAR